ncbi:MAG: hypothetical protein E6H07_17585 [Bacteroidetes bacterium]|nr:MAG: hypothetical protein E6H07_17585 [Bacteroidota bacterium]
MKRMLLLILSFAFLGLWIVGLFSPDRSSSIHIALIVALLFFLRSIMTLGVDIPAVKKTSKENN